MAQKKKLTPAQREKKQQAAEARKLQKKQAKIKAAVIAGAAVLAVILAVILLVTVLSDKNTHTSSTGDPGTTQPAQSTAPAEKIQGDGATLETAVATHIAKIEIENYGTITLELFGNTAPISVNNFVALAESGYYTGLTFHRIIENFMMQGGAPNADSPELTPIPGEFASNGYVNNLKHLRGVISMARSSVMDSATSQFFIMHVDKPHLDGDYAAFGMVTDGIEIVDAICTDANPTDGNGSIAKADQPVILSVTVEPV